MHPKSHYIKLRAKHQPPEIKLIFVLESPPASGKYFYDPTGKTTEPLFAGLMKAISEQPATKEDGLRAFARKDFFLVDATYKPLNHIRNNKKRNEAILFDLPELILDLKTTIRNQRVKIVLVKANICRMLEAPLKAIGMNVINEGAVIPFPSSGNQNKFHQAIQKVFARNKIKLTRTY